VLVRIRARMASQVRVKLKEFRAGQGAPAVNPASRIGRGPGDEHYRRASSQGFPQSAAPNGARRRRNYSTTSANDGSFRFASVDQGQLRADRGNAPATSAKLSARRAGQTKVIEVVSEKNTSGIEPEAHAAERDRRARLRRRRRPQCSPSTSKCGAIRTLAESGSSRNRKNGFDQRFGRIQDPQSASRTILCECDGPAQRSAAGYLQRGTRRTQRTWPAGRRRTSRRRRGF